MSDSHDLSTLRRAPSASTAATAAPPRRSFAARVVLPGTLLVAFAGLLVWSGRETLQAKVDVKLVPVVMRSGTGGGGGGASVARAAGWIEPEPYAIDASSLIEGTVEQVLVLEGDRVQYDQVVARLVPHEVPLERDAAHAALAAAKAREAAAAARAAAARPTLEFELARDEARASAAVAEARSALRAAESAAKAAGESASAEAARLRRAESDFASGLVSANEVEEMRRRADSMRSAAAGAASESEAAAKRLDAAEADVAALKARRAVEDGTASGAAAPDLALGPTCATARAELDEARAETRGMQAEADRQDFRVDHLEVRAPAPGIVLERKVAVGSRVGGDMPATIVTLYDPDYLRVRVDIPLADAAKVSLRQEARVTVEALPGRVFRGFVKRLVQLADTQKNTVQVQVLLDEPDRVLRPEMLARVEFEGAAPAAGAPTSEARSVFALDRLLRRSGPEGHAMAWVAEDGKAAVRHLRLGAGSAMDGGEKWTEVLDGLRPGDDLIDADPSLLSEGRALRTPGGAR